MGRSALSLWMDSTPPPAKNKWLSWATSHTRTPPFPIIAPVSSPSHSTTRHWAHHCRALWWLCWGGWGGRQSQPRRCPSTPSQSYPPPKTPAEKGQKRYFVKAKIHPQNTWTKICKIRQFLLRSINKQIHLHKKEWINSESENLNSIDRPLLIREWECRNSLSPKLSSIFCSWFCFQFDVWFFFTKKPPKD